MKKIVIVKVGGTLSALADKKGDFEDWALAGLGIDGERAVVVDVCSGALLPDYGGIAGIVVTGSHASVAEHLDWSEQTAAWLAGAVARGVPVLGICYGHQLLAYALGGAVDSNPNGLEFGTLPVQLTSDAQEDALLGGFPSPLEVQLCHAQTVLRLPDGARRLASSDMDANQAFVVGELAWGVQFHPEFEAEVVIAYIRHFREQLLAQGQEPDRLIQNCKDTPYGAEILRRFARLVDKRA